MDINETGRLAAELMAKMREYDCSSLNIEVGGVKISLGRGGAAQSPDLASAACAPVSIAVSSSSSGAPEVPAASGVEVRSPIVGTYYAAPSPDAEPYVSVGSKVAKGEVLCVVEAMKMFNEIEAPCNGVVSRICVQNGGLVEFNQTVMVIERED